MVLGSAGIFGGNARTVAISPTKAATAKQPQTKHTLAFAPTLKTAVQVTPLATAKSSAGADILTNANNLTAKSLARPAVNHILATANASTSILLTTGLPAVAIPSTPAVAPAAKKATTATVAPAATATDPPTVIDTLKAALLNAGMDITGMEFTEHRDLVTYPGGSYINDLISLKTSGGRTHDYMTDLVAIAPQVTVVEIQQLLAGNRG